MQKVISESASVNQRLLCFTLQKFHTSAIVAISLLLTSNQYVLVVLPILIGSGLRYASLLSLSNSTSDIIFSISTAPQ